MSIRLTVALAIAIVVSGCVPYPIYKTLQPVASITVVDATGKPVIGASVTLIANRYPYGREHHRSYSTTSQAGIASFDAMREWRTEVLMLHGAEEFFWNWCISGEGFETFNTHNKDASSFVLEPTVQLVAGISSPCRQSTP